MNLSEIGYLTEPVPAWNKALDSATTLDEIRAVATAWRPLASDAAAKIEAWSLADFDAFRSALKAERKGRFAGEEAVERFGDVIMPTVLFCISMVAEQFKAPWGLAYIRLREQGKVVERNGVAEWKP